MFSDLSPMIWSMLSPIWFQVLATGWAFFNKKYFYHLWSNLLLSYLCYLSCETMARKICMYLRKMQKYYKNFLPPPLITRLRIPPCGTFHALCNGFKMSNSWFSLTTWSIAINHASNVPWGVWHVLLSRPTPALWEERHRSSSQTYNRKLLVIGHNFL